MSTAMDSFDKSPLDAFVKSPLDARNAPGNRGLVYSPIGETGLFSDEYFAVNLRGRVNAPEGEYTFDTRSGFTGSLADYGAVFLFGPPSASGWVPPPWIGDLAAYGGRVTVGHFNVLIGEVNPSSFYNLFQQYSHVVASGNITIPLTVFPFADHPLTEGVGGGIGLVGTVQVFNVGANIVPLLNGSRSMVYSTNPVGSWVVGWQFGNVYIQDQGRWIRNVFDASI